MIDYEEGMTAHRARLGGLSVPAEVVDVATLEQHDIGGWCWHWMENGYFRKWLVDVEVEAE